MKILLVSMPFGALERQALGISILKPLLQSHGHFCDIRYLTFPFAEMIGPEVYQWMGYQLPYTAFAGDWCFTEALYGPGRARQGYEETILRKRWQQDEESVQRVLSVRNHVPRFLDYAIEAVAWNQYDLVGFTSTFEQNIASLAMAKRVKERFPKVKILFGGANWEDEMGLELHRQFPFVDYVCSGEAEHALPLLIEAIGSGAKGVVEKRLAAIPGVVYRAKNGESRYTGHGIPIEEMDRIPTPDFADYFSALEGSSCGTNILPGLLFESSRGCWWGAKSHCTFCGLNGNSMKFRSKTQTRALAELKQQTVRWNPAIVEAADNILDMSYFESFLPAVAEANLGVDIFYEVKANLSRRHLRKLRAARVMRIQPGIESMSDHVLRLMRKGTTGLRNIQLLKWCAEYEIKAEWNLLYGFPGETAEDYAAILKLLPGIRHFNPPAACGPLRLDRFSPFHHTPGELGVHNLRPIDSLPYLYPFSNEALLRIAYYFDFDYVDGRDPLTYVRPVIDYCNEWKQQQDDGKLQAALMPDGVLGILDTRAGIRKAIRLDGWKQAAYERCDSMQTAAGVERAVRAAGHTSLASAEIVAFLQECCDANLMVTDGAYFLGTAIAKGSLRQRLEAQEDRLIRPSTASSHHPPPIAALQQPAAGLVQIGSTGA
jgi:ribosomal peptide maturation radical SAM protein 1